MKSGLVKSSHHNSQEQTTFTKKCRLEGERTMAHTQRRGWRTLALGLGVLLIGTLLIGQVPATRAQPPAKKDSKTEKPEKPAKPEKEIQIVVPKIPGINISGPDGEVVKSINSMLEEGWRANSLQPSHPASDYEFIRRATLDIIGRIAKPAEIVAFMNDAKDSRRTNLIKKLLESEEYPKHWANMWTNWLLTRSSVFGKGKYKEETQVWLEDQFAQNKTHDEIARALISAKGKNTDNGAVNFILAHVGEAVPRDKHSEEGQFDMVPITSRITRLFLGIQTQCTQCHDHPFDNRLRQEHFWGINVFLRQVHRDGTPPMEGGRMMTYAPLELKEDTNVNAEAAVFFEKRNGVVRQTKAVFLNGAKMPAETTNRRDELARLIVEHDSFPKAYVNRLWAHFFGRGFTQPIDDFNEQNEPSNPELLKELSKQYKHYKFDQKRLITWLCNSTAYNLSSVANKTNDKPDTDPYFSRMLLKVMAPEQLYESLMLATQREVGKEARKTERDRWLDNLISNFGDDEGNEVNFNGTVVQALLMMNGNDINKAIAPEDTNAGLVYKSIAKHRGAPDAVIKDLYLATLNRLPTQKEIAKVKSDFTLRTGTRDTPAAAYQDLLWALVNSNEFILNH